ncbi:MAG TPA: hypothetical protein PLE10_03155 [Brevefilum sp.]|nr:hypothetical protein [Brevefilum sp.]HOR18810.1 hypothetical protein [Brevefilum sp.]HPL68710.1 hypothetical protein [Brevefilum sp.]
MNYYKRETLYYNAHPDTPDVTLNAIFDRAELLNIRYLVTASASGGTAVRAIEIMEKRKLEIQIVCASNPVGWNKPGINPMKPENRRFLEDKGVKILQGSRPLNGIDFAFQKRFGGMTLATSILEAYLRFSEGVFHAIQVATMAADAGFIPTDEDIISEALYDTALVMRAGNLNSFFDTNIKEVIALATYQTEKLSWE